MPDCTASADAVGETMGWLGCAAAFILFLSPVPTFAKIMKSRSVGDFSCTPYLCSLLNCALWTTYALPFVTPCKTQPLVTNGVGLVMEVVYILLFIAYAAPHKRRPVAVQFVGCICIIAGIDIFALLAAPRLHVPSIPADKHLSPATTVLGLASTLFNIGMYAAPLSVMRLVIRTKSVAYMPLPLTLAVGFCSTCWLIFAIHVSDDFIMIPNALGLGLCGAQVLLYACYCRDKSKEDMTPIVRSAEVDVIP